MNTLTRFGLSLLFIASLTLTACGESTDDHGHSHDGDASIQHDDDHGHAHDETESAPETESFYGDDPQPADEQTNQQTAEEAEAAEDQHDHAHDEHGHNH